MRGVEAMMKKRRTPTPVPPDTPDDFVEAAPRLQVRARPDPLFAPPPAIVETVFFSRVGHTFKQGPQIPGMDVLYVVQDFLLDQTGASGADGEMAASKAFDLTTAVSYRFNVWPKDRSKRIEVVPPTTGPVFFALDVGRRFVNAASEARCRRACGGESSGNALREGASQLSLRA
jgi:hypothetical protein